MLSSDEGEDDLFFDSSNYLSIEESIVAKKELEFGKLDYEIWFNQPRSVEERRESFLQRMGLAEVAPKNKINKSSQVMSLERIRECSGAIYGSLSSSVNGAEENLVFCGRELNCEANSMVDDELNQQGTTFEGENSRFSHSAQECEQSEAQAHPEECKNVNKKKMKSWWKHFVGTKDRKGRKYGFEVSKPNPKMMRIKVQQYNKRCLEFTALYVGQEIQAHKGFISTMKFSPDGQYLASAGEDGVVRIWPVTSTDAPCQSFIDEGDFSNCE